MFFHPQVIYVHHSSIFSTCLIVSGVILHYKHLRTVAQSTILFIDLFYFAIFHFLLYVVIKCSQQTVCCDLQIYDQLKHYTFAFSSPTIVEAPSPTTSYHHHERLKLIYNRSMKIKSKAEGLHESAFHCVYFKV